MLSVLSINDLKQGAIYDEAASLRALAVVAELANVVRRADHFIVPHTAPCPVRVAGPMMVNATATSAIDRQLVKSLRPQRRSSMWFIAPRHGGLAR